MSCKRSFAAVYIYFSDHFAVHAIRFIYIYSFFNLKIHKGYSVKRKIP